MQNFMSLNKLRRRNFANVPNTVSQSTYAAHPRDVSYEDVHSRVDTWSGGGDGGRADGWMRPCKCKWGGLRARYNAAKPPKYSRSFEVRRLRILILSSWRCVLKKFFWFCIGLGFVVDLVFLIGESLMSVLKIHIDLKKCCRDTYFIHFLF